MGTELDRRGVATRLPLWSAWGLIEAPERVLEVHRDYTAAGAEIAVTCTFRTHRRSLDKAGLGNRAGELTALAVELAREALPTDRPAWVAGSIAPLEDCYRPELTPPEEELREEHAEIVRHLTEAGVDLLLVETMPTIREAVAAAGAAVSTGRPVFVALVCGRDGRLFSGERVSEAAAALGMLGASALLIDCTPWDAVRRPLAELRAATELPVGAYANVGHAEDKTGWATTQVVDPDAYAAEAETWLDAGAGIIGGCCGTQPEHIEALAALLRRRARHRG
jgi:S-methylmethionine-dependent homocysteine/selenocysteine methylase